MFNNRLILLTLSVVIVSGAVLFFKTAPGDSPQTNQVADGQSDLADMVYIATTSSASEKDTASNSESKPEAETLAGTHIMPDGTVMDGAGLPVMGAEILDSGNIRLDDGTIITPKIDMRPDVSNVTETEKPKHHVIDIVGTDFAYDIKQIKVKQGDTVTINLISKKGFHDWVIDELKAATKRINEGDKTSVTFVADKVGTFQYYCSVMNHRQLGMVGYLIVE